MIGRPMLGVSVILCAAAAIPAPALAQAQLRTDRCVATAPPGWTASGARAGAPDGSTAEIRNVPGHATVVDMVRQLPDFVRIENTNGYILFARRLGPGAVQYRSAIKQSPGCASLVIVLSSQNVEAGKTLARSLALRGSSR